MWHIRHYKVNAAIFGTNSLSLYSVLRICFMLMYTVLGVLSWHEEEQDNDLFQLFTKYVFLFCSDALIYFLSLRVEFSTLSLQLCLRAQHAYPAISPIISGMREL